ncbi:glutathione peroxidase [Acetobacteraceae bacterium ESL0709]|nr:glutathione peroxidase [Acetobacteraceae bacterium ESL0697]MDF7677802.1 glutathione peroxidase [Acetobacteraceae bacterium ESL0709]
MSKTAYDFTLPSLNGGTLDFSQWQGRPLIIVNTASKCGFTPQYEALQELWEELYQAGSDGPVIIGIPSGDFGNQEFEKTQDIWGFCEKNYGITFPLASKSTVKGPGAIPLFQWLAKEGGFLSLPRWNFYKYLIDRKGHLHSWYTPLTSPAHRRFHRAVKHLASKD